jgi:hypothetical protein
LGRWDAAGGRYIGGGGAITLITKDGKHVAQGKKISNNLCKMKTTIQNPHKTPSKKCTVTPLMFIGSKLAHSWEEWHRRFGHVGYSGLQKLLDKKLVEGLNIDEHTPKPNCVACTEAKLHAKPFPKETRRTTEPGELTHIDLWGKYAVKSINSNEYYLLFVDDAKRYNSQLRKEEIRSRPRSYKLFDSLNNPRQKTKGDTNQWWKRIRE